MRIHLDISTSLGTLQRVESDGWLLRILLLKTQASIVVIGDDYLMSLLEDTRD